MSEATKPQHGDTGDRHITTRYGETGCCASTVWTNARWCDQCRDWVAAQSVVTLILGSIGCPKCGKKW